MALTAALMPLGAFAQTPARTGGSVLATRTGNEINVSAQHYTYTEPMDIDVTMHGPKAGAEYTGTFSLSQRSRWFGQVNLRATGVTVNYDGSCRPWLIVPSTTSANGYRLTLGTTSPCQESDDRDWYVEGRALTGKDFIGSAWAVTPFAGVGFRHLSNGTNGTPNYRTEQYLYVPVGATLRTTSLSDHVLGVTVEYDHLIRGWNTTRNSLLGGGTVPATSTAPAFTIGDFTDFSFQQTRGWAARASASIQVSRSWSLEPYYTRWSVKDSSTDTGSVAYAVNGITARQTLNAVEPHNFTEEAGVKLKFRFGGR